MITGQMYVERLLPHSGVKQKYPLICLHGAAQTGTVCRIHSGGSFVPWQLLSRIFPELAQHSRRPSRLGILFPRSRLRRLHYRSASSGPVSSARAQNHGLCTSRIGGAELDSNRGQQVALGETAQPMARSMSCSPSLHSSVT